MTITQEAPAEHTDYLVEVLFKEARRRRRRRWAIGLLSLAVGATGLAFGFGGRGSGMGPSVTAQVSGAGSYQALEVPSRQTTAALLDYFFPTSGATFAEGFQFGNALMAVESKDVARCVASKKFPSPPPWTPLAYSGNNTEFPYVSYLMVHGFGVAPGPTVRRTPDPSQGMSPIRAAQFRSTTQECRASVLGVFEPVLRYGAALEDLWMTQVVTGIDNGPPFQHALVGWRSCMNEAGIEVLTIDSFFTYADRQAHQGSILGIARTYARCLAPAEAIRDSLRQIARVAFLDAHASAVAQLVHDVNGVLAGRGA